MPVAIKLDLEELARLVTEDLESKGWKVCPKSRMSIELDEEIGTGHAEMQVCGNGFNCPCDEIERRKQEKIDKANRLGKESEYTPNGDAVRVSDLFNNNEEDDDLAGFE